MGAVGSRNALTLLLCPDLDGSTDAAAPLDLYPRFVFLQPLPCHSHSVTRPVQRFRSHSVGFGWVSNWARSKNANRPDQPTSWETKFSFSVRAFKHAFVWSLYLQLGNHVLLLNGLSMSGWYDLGSGRQLNSVGGNRIK